jgi:hypothetical protein
MKREERLKSIFMPHFMPAAQIFEAIQASSIGTAIRQSLVVFPVVETVHVVSLSLSVGLILISDLRLIGAALTDVGIAEVMRPLRRWMLTGFALMFASGGLLFWAEAAKCYRSGAFRLKMLFLILAGLNALIFEVGAKRSPRIAGWASLACWCGVIVCGRWTAYVLN